MDKMEKTFDTRESWSMFRNKGHHWIVFHSPRYADPFWIASFNRRVNRVEYFCPPKHPVSGQGIDEISCPLGHPLDQLLLMYFFARRQGILTHSAGVILNGKAYLFAGASGAGKSTFSQLLVQARAGKMLSDERMIVRDIKGETIAFGTPWAGTAGIARNGSAPLAGIFLLKHGKSNRIRKIEAASAADRLLPLSSVPWYDLDTAASIIAFAKRLTNRVPAYEFRFTPDCSAVEFLRKFLKVSS